LRLPLYIPIIKDSTSPLFHLPLLSSVISFASQLQDAFSAVDQPSALSSLSTHQP
jgi:hypothetical protein